MKSIAAVVFLTLFLCSCKCANASFESNTSISSSASSSTSTEIPVEESLFEPYSIPESIMIPLLYVNNSSLNIVSKDTEIRSNELWITGIGFQYESPTTKEIMHGGLMYGALYRKMPEEVSKLTITFEDMNGTIMALTSIDEDEPCVTHIYHPVLEDWAILHSGTGVLIYQDTLGDFDAWVEANKNEDEWHEAWEPYYPAVANEWLLSPFESRGFVVPFSESVYNVTAWDAEYKAVESIELHLNRHFEQLTPENIVPIKTFGDLAQGVLSYQNSAGEWFMVSYGFDGAGFYGGLAYYIYDSIPDKFISQEPLGWQTSAAE